jgi:hypothetical protein
MSDRKNQNASDHPSQSGQSSGADDVSARQDSSHNSMDGTSDQPNQPAKREGGDAKRGSGTTRGSGKR